MPASLGTYRKKRDFRKTAEPRGDDYDVVAATGLPRFVVQKHAARRLHYDLRLEIDGVLKSWALPRGPSLDPAHRRLAVEVEDHPLDYLAFEGTIPAGEYGGGTVMVWDQGSFSVDGDALEGWQAGRLTLTLAGQKLRGRFRLVRMPHRDNEKHNSWLLMHGRDAHAVDGGDVDHLPATSAKTGRALDEIARANDAVWRSDRAAARATNSEARPSPSRARGPAPAERTTKEAKKTTAKKTTATKKTTARTARTTSASRARPPSLPTSGSQEAADAGDALVAGVRISNPQRRVFADSELTKRDVARYLEAVAPLLLPHVRARPLSVVRCPQGSRSPCFFQKHPSKGMPSGIHAVDVDGDDQSWLSVDDVAGLVGLAQMGMLELHPWGSLPGSPEQPGRLVMDLDPAEGVPWSQVREGAEALRVLLQERGLRSFLLSTGGKGVHVIAPLDGRASWEEVRGFARDVAEGVSSAAPARFTANPRKAARVGRIFIDHLRNGRGSTAVAPFSPRARAGAPVAVPLGWQELDDAVTITLLTLPERLRFADPWADFFAVKQGLPAHRSEAEAPGLSRDLRRRGSEVPA